MYEGTIGWVHIQGSDESAENHSVYGDDRLAVFVGRRITVGMWQRATTDDYAESARHSYSRIDLNPSAWLSDSDARS